MTTFPFPPDEHGARPGVPPAADATEIITLPYHGRPVTRRSRAVPVLAALLAVALALAGYLLTTTITHQHASSRWQALAERKADELAATQRDLDGASNELTAVRDQLATATARITSLADEKAKIGDQIASEQQIADYRLRVTNAASTVASALNRCVTAQKQLIGYLGNSTQYNSADLAQYATDVDGLCRSAQDANATLQVELSR